VSRGKTSVGIDINTRSITIATLKRERRRITVVDVQTIDTPQLLDRHNYRDTHHITQAINHALESHITTKPNISLTAMRNRTPMTTVPLKGLTRQKATQVITAQANRHFPNPTEHTLAVDTAQLTIRGKKPKTNNWLAAATPNTHLKAISDIEEGINRPITRVTPKAIATLRAAHPNITTPGDHLILNGSDDGADLTLILDGTIEVLRLLGPNLERDIKPELARTLDYLRSEDRDPPTLHLAAYLDQSQHLAETLQVDVMNVTPWEAPNLTLDPALEENPETLQTATTAIGLALGGLDPQAPDLNLRSARRRAPATQAPAPQRANVMQAASLLAILGAGGYHLMTTLSVNNLRSNINTLNTQLMNSANPQRQTIQELQTNIDQLLHHQALAQQLTSQRLHPTQHIERVVNGLPSTAHSHNGEGLRFQTLTLRTTTETPTAYQPLPADTTPATLITITGIAPDQLTLEQDLRTLEANESLRAHVRHANRTHPDMPDDTSISTQLEILTLEHPNREPPANTPEPLTALRPENNP